MTASCARTDWIDRTLVTVDVTGVWTERAYIPHAVTGLIIDLGLTARSGPTIQHPGAIGSKCRIVRPDPYFAAMPAISTKYFGAASLASTVARAGGFAGSIQASHTLFMSSK